MVESAGIVVGACGPAGCGRAASQARHLWAVLASASPCTPTPAHLYQVPLFLERSRQLWEQVLAAMDAMDGPAADAILARLQACEASPLVRSLAARLCPAAA